MGIKDFNDYENEQCNLNWGEPPRAYARGITRRPKGRVQAALALNLLVLGVEYISG